MTRGLVLGALLAGMIACAAGPRAARTPPVTSGSEPPVAPVLTGDPHAQIEALERDITAKGGTFEPQATMATAATPMSVPSSTDPTCHPAATPSCGDVCKLSDSICDDAKKICDIAVTLGNDTWAAGKCESGKQSCSDAHASCCSCR